MDFRAEKELCYEDAKTIKFVVFGGILGEQKISEKIISSKFDI